MQNAGYQELISKLDAFIRKYYLNQVIRGSLYTVGVVVASFIAFNLIEHYIFSVGNSPTGLRKGLFYGFIGLSAGALGYWVINPLVRFMRLGGVISHEQAAVIVGQHFSNVQDKLLNVLQLKRQADGSDNALLHASIEQKTKDLRLVSFKSAIDLRENKRYLRFALPPLLLLLLLLVTSNIIGNSTKRILLNDQEFEREALFRFVLGNEKPQVVQYEDYELEVKIEGEALPAEVFVEVDNYTYKLEKVNGSTFKYRFSKLQRDTKFRLSANGFSTKSYLIDVLEKPTIASFEVMLEYPAYTGRKPESLSNVGDLLVPAGTKLSWSFNTQNTAFVGLRFEGEESFTAAERQNERFKFAKKIDRDGRYVLFLKNDLLPQGDSIAYSLSVIPDQYPQIELRKQQDSTNKKLVFFAGEASDDYGIRSLQFVYKIERQGKTIKEDKENLPVGSGKRVVYDYLLDVNKFKLQPGDNLSYFFQVWDNDGVRGSKATTTPVMYFEVPTLAELKEKEEKNNESIKTDLEKALQEAQQLQRDVRKTQENILQKQNLNWQDRKELEKLLDKQKEVEKKVEDAKKSFEENKEKQKDFEPENKELLEKQQQLEDLFDKVMSEEMRKLFEELEQLMENLNKEEIFDKLKEMELNEQELTKELDRMLELFKKMEIEKNMQDAIRGLDSLAAKQEELSQKTEELNKQLENKAQPDAKDAAKQEELKKQQDELNKQFEELQKDIEKATEKNKELEQPFNLDEKKLDQKEKEVKENMKNSSQQLQQKQNKNASKSQKNAAEKMKEMSKEMQQQMQMNQMEQMEQDLKAMRQLLENLVDMSMAQERLFLDVEKVVPNTPPYVRLVQDQFKLKEDFRQIEDSLQALAKRVFQLSGYINTKVSDVKKTMQKGLYHLEERQKREAVVQQQYTMTAVNDLALILSESMDQMQQQMAQQMPGQQMCEKPQDGEGEGEGEGQGDGKGKGKKGKKPGLGQIPDMQRQLNEQMKQMQEQMKQGQQPGSKGFAEMAAKQAAIRKALQDLKKQQGKGQNAKEMQELIDQMNKVETELVNKRLPNDMQKRQQDILSRLLEAASAEREREFEEKRKADRPDDTTPSMPPALKEYLRERQSQVEQFRTVSPVLKPHYRRLVEQYYKGQK